MNLDKFTQKAQEADYHQAQIEPDHPLLALLQQTDGVVPRVIARGDAVAA